MAHMGSAVSLNAQSQEEVRGGPTLCASFGMGGLTTFSVGAVLAGLGGVCVLVPPGIPAAVAGVGMGGVIWKTTDDRMLARVWGAIFNRKQDSKETSSFAFVLSEEDMQKYQGFVTTYHSFKGKVDALEAELQNLKTELSKMSSFALLSEFFTKKHSLCLRIQFLRNSGHISKCLKEIQEWPKQGCAPISLETSFSREEVFLETTPLQSQSENDGFEVVDPVLFVSGERKKAIAPLIDAVMGLINSINGLEERVAVFFDFNLLVEIFAKEIQFEVRSSLALSKGQLLNQEQQDSSNFIADLFSQQLKKWHEAFLRGSFLKAEEEKRFIDKERAFLALQQTFYSALEKYKENEGAEWKDTDLITIQLGALKKLLVAGEMRGVIASILTAFWGNRIFEEALFCYMDMKKVDVYCAQFLSKMEKDGTDLITRVSNINQNLEKWDLSKTFEEWKIRKEGKQENQTELRLIQELADQLLQEIEVLSLSSNQALDEKLQGCFPDLKGPLASKKIRDGIGVLKRKIEVVLNDVGALKRKLEIELNQKLLGEMLYVYFSLFCKEHTPNRNSSAHFMALTQTFLSALKEWGMSLRPETIGNIPYDGLVALFITYLLTPQQGGSLDQWAGLAQKLSFSEKKHAFTDALSESLNSNRLIEEVIKEYALALMEKRSSGGAVLFLSANDPSIV